MLKTIVVPSEERIAIAAVKLLETAVRLYLDKNIGDESLISTAINIVEIVETLEVLRCKLSDLEMKKDIVLAEVDKLLHKLVELENNDS